MVALRHFSRRVSRGSRLNSELHPFALSARLIFYLVVSNTLRPFDNVHH